MRVVLESDLNAAAEAVHSAFTAVEQKLQGLKQRASGSVFHHEIADLEKTFAAARHHVLRLGLVEVHDTGPAPDAAEDPLSGTSSEVASPPQTPVSAPPHETTAAPPAGEGGAGERK